MRIKSFPHLFYFHSSIVQIPHLTVVHASIALGRHRRLWNTAAGDVESIHGTHRLGIQDEFRYFPEH